MAWDIGRLYPASDLMKEELNFKMVHLSLERNLCPLRQEMKSIALYNSGKNVLHFLLISAHNQIQSNWVSRCNYYLPTLHGVGVFSSNSPQKLIPTRETVLSFLYHPIKTATHSLCCSILIPTQTNISGS